jgi:hypothetical protein
VAQVWDGDRRLEYKRTSARVFLQFVASKIPQFIIHQHTARWQDVQYKACLANLQPGEVMSLIDFAENYSFKGQDEIQSQHWYNFQLTILVHITYSVNPSFNVLDPKSKRLKTNYFYYISDDKIHDSRFVQHCLNIHWKSLRDAVKTPTRHIIWSDGCSAQFKCATAWFYVSKWGSMNLTLMQLLLWIHLFVYALVIRHMLFVDASLAFLMVYLWSADTHLSLCAMSYQLGVDLIGITGTHVTGRGPMMGLVHA